MLIDIAGTESLPPLCLVGLLLPGKFIDLILDVVDFIEEQMLAILPLFFYIKDAQFIPNAFNKSLEEATIYLSIVQDGIFNLQHRQGTSGTIIGSEIF